MIQAGPVPKDAWLPAGISQDDQTSFRQYAGLCQAIGAHLGTYHRAEAEAAIAEGNGLAQFLLLRYVQSSDPAYMKWKTQGAQTLLELVEPLLPPAAPAAPDVQGPEKPASGASPLR